MKLDDAQSAKVAEWIAQGMKLSEVQVKLASEFGLHVTYMDVRFLIDDLKLRVKDVEPPKPPPTVAPAAPAKAPAAGGAAVPLTPLPEEDQIGGGIGGGVSVTVDHVARAGALVSGKVTFSDGKSAEWTLDQYGRLGLAAAEKGYRPSQQDVMQFQTALQTELAKLGY